MFFNYDKDVVSFREGQNTSTPFRQLCFFSFGVLGGAYVGLGGALRKKQSTKTQETN